MVELTERMLGMDIIPVNEKGSRNEKYLVFCRSGKLRFPSCTPTTDKSAEAAIQGFDEAQRFNCESNYDVVKSDNGKGFESEVFQDHIFRKAGASYEPSPPEEQNLNPAENQWRQVKEIIIPVLTRTHGRTPKRDGPPVPTQPANLGGGQLPLGARWQLDRQSRAAWSTGAEAHRAGTVELERAQQHPSPRIAAPPAGGAQHTRQWRCSSAPDS